jgi:signal transduction histidine kinase
LSRKHFGLVGMYERAGLIDAKVKISAKPGKGTTVAVRWPAATDLPDTDSPAHPDF